MTIPRTDASPPISEIVMLFARSWVSTNDLGKPCCFLLVWFLWKLQSPL